MVKEKSTLIIHKKHDKLFRTTFSDKAVALSFIEDYLPKNVTERFDLSTLQPEKDSFIDDEKRIFL